MAVHIGIIGVGIIGEPFVRGLAGGPEDIDVHLSPRNAERSARLAAEFANVTVEESNQDVVDKSDWVVLALLPEAAEAIVRDLTFRPDQRIITFISTATLAQVRDWTGVESVTKMVPLPYVAYRVGPIATYPLTPEVEEVFGRLGTLAATEDEDGLNAMSTITSMQSAFFATIGEVAVWGGRNGLSPESSQRFTLDFLEALIHKARTLTPDELADHWREMTPGGLNHTAITLLQNRGSLHAWQDAMDAVKRRRQVQTSGNA
ncbi:MAG: NAD(P)-binding domain-containing protein [Propionibacteriaceae bacterium]|jgi:pyrroline-5-carboxylate reductase|nr:NAD(P)-binding domain-containing protein [Propionibacteriaceae bacterium]